MDNVNSPCGHKIGEREREISAYCRCYCSQITSERWCQKKLDVHYNTSVINNSLFFYYAKRQENYQVVGNTQ